MNIPVINVAQTVETPSVLLKHDGSHPLEMFRDSVELSNACRTFYQERLEASASIMQRISSESQERGFPDSNKCVENCQKEVQNVDHNNIRDIPQCVEDLPIENVKENGIPRTDHSCDRTDNVIQTTYSEFGDSENQTICQCCSGNNTKTTSSVCRVEHNSQVNGSIDSGIIGDARPVFPHLNGNGSRRETISSPRSSIDGALGMLRRQVASLVNSDLDLMKQLLTMNETIEDLKIRQRRACADDIYSRDGSAWDMMQSTASLSGKTLIQPALKFSTPSSISLQLEGDDPARLSVYDDDDRTNTFNRSQRHKDHRLSAVPPTAPPEVNENGAISPASVFPGKDSTGLGTHSSFQHGEVLLVESCTERKSSAPVFKEPCPQNNRHSYTVQNKNVSQKSIMTAICSQNDRLKTEKQVEQNRQQKVRQTQNSTKIKASQNISSRPQSQAKSNISRTVPILPGSCLYNSVAITSLYKQSSKEMKPQSKSQTTERRQSQNSDIIPKTFSQGGASKQTNERSKETKRSSRKSPKIYRRSSSKASNPISGPINETPAPKSQNSNPNWTVYNNASKSAVHAKIRNTICKATSKIPFHKQLSNETAHKENKQKVDTASTGSNGGTESHDSGINDVFQ